MSTTPETVPTDPADALAATVAQWRRLVEAELKGVPFEKKLVSRTAEGIALQPVYTRADVKGLPFLLTAPGEAPYLRGFQAAATTSARRWECCQEIAAVRGCEFNRAVLADLMAGQDSVALTPDVAARSGLDPDEVSDEWVGEGGVSIIDSDDVQSALRGIDLQAIPLHVRAGAEPFAIAALVLAEARDRGVSWTSLRGSIAADPVAHALETGNVAIDWPTAEAHLAGWTRWATTHAPELRTIGVDTSLWHEAGGTAAHELGYALATGISYVRALVGQGLTFEEIGPRIRFTLAAGPQFFMEIAKFRAWRLLWTRALVAAGAPPEIAARATVHARTGRWTQSLLDVQVNGLRATTAALSAVLGGVDSLHVSPIDEVTGRSDDFSRRIGRNVHTLLAEEFRFTVPTDAAGGAWSVEVLTDALARKAWAQFQEIEKQGGMVAAIEAGGPQRAVAAAAAERRTAFATRRSALVGTNLFPNPKDKLPVTRRSEREAFRLTRSRVARERRGQSIVFSAPTGGWSEKFAAALAAARDGATVGQLARLGRGGNATRPIPPVIVARAAEPFEALRARAAALPDRPRVFLAKMGPIAQHKARADFSLGFFSVGGFEPIAKRTFEAAEEAAQAAIASAANVVVLCSTDETYPALVPPFAQAIKVARPNVAIVLAGLPTDPAVVAAYREAGINEFIHVRADVVSILNQLLFRSEVSS